MMLSPLKVVQDPTGNGNTILPCRIEPPSLVGSRAISGQPLLTLQIGCLRELNNVWKQLIVEQEFYELWISHYNFKVNCARNSKFYGVSLRICACRCGESLGVFILISELIDVASYKLVLYDCPT